MYKTNISTKKYRAKSRPFSLGVAGIMGLAGLGVAMGSASVLASDSSEVGIDVNVGTVLSLAVYPTGDHTGEQASQVSLNAMPGGPLATNAVDVVVNTNVKSGYQLTLRDSDNDNSLKNIKSDASIPTLEDSVAADDFPTGFYGYSIDGESFFGIPTLSAEPAILKQVSTLDPGVSDTTTVTFGVKVSNSEPGDYTTSVIFTVSPELVPTDPFTKMLEWTPGLYWDTYDTKVTKESFETVCEEKGKRRPTIDEMSLFFSEQEITKDKDGVRKLFAKPYNFHRGYYYSSSRGGSKSYGTYEVEYGINGPMYSTPPSDPNPLYDLYHVRCVKDKE